MDQRKPCEFELALDKLLGDLGLATDQAKAVHYTGVTYNFFWDECPFYISAPATVPNDYSHVFRMEIELAELNELDAGRVLYEVASYLHIHDCTLVRVVPKPSKARTIKILLQAVGLVDWLKPEFILVTITHMADLASYFRETVIAKNNVKAA